MDTAFNKHKGKHQKRVLQQQVRALHRETGRVQTAPQGCFSSGSISTAVAGQLGERPLRDSPQLGRWESENPHQGRLQGESALVSSLQGRPGYRDKSRAHGAGDGGRESALPHRQHPSQLLVLLFCSSGDEDRLLPDGQTKGAVNAWVCSPECAGSFVRKGERTRESPYDVGLITGRTEAAAQPTDKTDGRVLALGLTPDEETLTGFWNGNGGRDSRGCLTPGPQARLRPSRRQAVLPEAQSTWSGS